ncbi:MAG: hypothetical protein ACOYN0_07570 [Phycisphaerales bacterium]
MRTTVLVMGAATALAAASANANELTNPGFEAGYAGWISFGNAYTELGSATFPAHSGDRHAKMFGNFSGGFNVTGAFQSFSAAPGQTWSIDCFSYNWSTDPMSGGNWAVMKLAFFNASNSEIGAAEGIILNAASPRDAWIDNAEVFGVAPAGTVSVQTFLLFLQPEFAGGAAWFDDVVVTPAPGAAALLGLGGLLAGRRRR